MFDDRGDAEQWIDAELSQYDDDSYRIVEVQMTREKFASLEEFAGW